MGTKKANDVQIEMEHMPPASPLGRAARALMAVRDEIEQVNEDLAKKEKVAKTKLLDLLDAEGKESIVVDGATFRKVHKDASNEIRVIVKKKKKKKSDNDEE